MEGCKKLGTIESVGTLFVGPPAATPDRDVVEKSFGVALIVHFEELSDHDAYQEDPVHQEFIEKYGHLWERVQVYDSAVE